MDNSHETRILIVSDREWFGPLKLILQSEDRAIMGAFDETTALERVKGQGIVIVFDGVVGDKTAELTHQLRESEPNAVIILVGGEDVEQKREKYGADYSCNLYKLQGPIGPLNLQELVGRIEVDIRRRREIV